MNGDDSTHDDVALRRSELRLSDLRVQLEQRLQLIQALRDESSAHIRQLVAERDKACADYQNIVATRTFRYTRIAREAYGLIRKRMRVPAR
jgi:hypothetical protein